MEWNCRALRETADSKTLDWPRTIYMCLTTWTGRIIWNVLIVVGRYFWLVFTFLSRWRWSLAQDSEHVVVSSMPHFTVIGASRRPRGTYKPKYDGIFKFNILWWRHLAARTESWKQGGYSITNILISTDVKIVSNLKLLYGNTTL